jgi:hypothetical protein
MNVRLAVEERDALACGAESYWFDFIIATVKLNEIQCFA